MSNKKVIGLSGVARAGKDTFAAILEMKLQQAGKSVKKVSLAGPLKQQCDSFLTSNLGISAFSQVTEEKNIIRPFLVGMGMLNVNVPMADTGLNLQTKKFKKVITNIIS